MNEARKTVMDGIEVIAGQMLARGASDARIAPLVEKIRTAISAKPDSYFVERLYPTSGTMDAGAFQKIWRETAAEIVK